MIPQFYIITPNTPWGNKKTKDQELRERQDQEELFARLMYEQTQREQFDDRRNTPVGAVNYNSQNDINVWDIPYIKYDMSSINPIDSGTSNYYNTVRSGSLSVVSGYKSNVNAVFFNGNSYLKTEGWFGRMVPNNFTCTGLSYDPILNVYYIGNFDSGSIVVVDVNFDYISQISNVLPANALQGITYDTSDNTLWVSDYTNKIIKHINKSGTDLGDGFSVPVTTNHIAYDSLTDSLWTVDNNISSTQFIRRFSCATGLQTNALTCSVAAATSFDGICIIPASRSLYVTSDLTTTNGVPLIYNITMSNGTVIDSFRDRTALEGITYNTSDNSWVVCYDRGYHGNMINGNKISKLQTNFSSSNELTKTFAVSMWIKPSTGSLSNVGLISNRILDAESRDSLTSHQFGVFSNKLYFRVETTAQQYLVTGSTSITNMNRWYHTCAVFNTSSIKVYVDGILENSTNTTGQLIEGSNDVWIGGYYSNANLFSGSISDIRIYNTFFTDNDVRSLYSSSLL